MIVSDAEMAEVGKENRLKKQKAQQEAELREAFMSRQVAPEAIDRINNAVRIAAQNGSISCKSLPSVQLLQRRRQKNQYCRS